MIDLRMGQDRGHADHGWLRTDHTFSSEEAEVQIEGVDASEILVFDLA